MEIKVWICPTEGCGNYFGTKNSDQPLQERIVGKTGINGEVFEEDRHRPRSMCPDCFELGNRVERIPTIIEIDLDVLRSLPVENVRYVGAQ